MNAGRLIAVDIGNTSTKLGWFEDAPNESPLPVLAAAHSYPTGQALPAEVATALPKEQCSWRIVSVHREGTRLLAEWIQSHRPADEFRLLTYSDLPIRIQVDFPERVGLDRLAAAVAVSALRDAGRAAIVITAGSAITVNLITAEGIFAGGAILPGFRMAAAALRGNTDQLPLTDLAPNEEPPPVLGKNTEAAIRSGLFWGAAGAVRVIIEKMSESLQPQPQIFVTGGDLRELANHLGDEATFIANLVLRGVAVGASKF